MAVCIGVDAAKAVHWAVGLDEGGLVVHACAVETNPAGIDTLIADLRSLEGEVVIGLDVVGSFAPFIGAGLLAQRFTLVHTPGIAVNRAGQGFSGGEPKSDPRDARTLAERVRTRALRPVLADDDTRLALRLKVGRRREVMQDQVRRIARIRGLLCGIHPGLEQAFALCCKAPLAQLTRYVTADEIRRAGKARIIAHLKKTPHLHGGEALVLRALEIAKAQHITVPGEATTAEPIRELALQALEARQKIVGIERDLEHILGDHPDCILIRSLPGMGVILTAEFLAAVGNIKRFTSADALAAAAGLAPVQRQSGKRSGGRRACGGNKALKRVFYQSAFGAVTKKDPLSKASYDRKREEGKQHTQALIALDPRRLNVLGTMLKPREVIQTKQKAA